MAKFINGEWLSLAVHSFCESSPINEDNIQHLISLAPTTEEHKVGKWIKDYDNSALDGLYHCSVCSRKLWIPKEESVSDYPYCHCGAKMDKEGE